MTSCIEQEYTSDTRPGQLLIIDQPGDPGREANGAMLRKSTKKPMPSAMVQEPQQSTKDQKTEAAPPPATHAATVKRGTMHSKPAGTLPSDQNQVADDEWDFGWEDGRQSWIQFLRSRRVVVLVAIVLFFTVLAVGFILLEHYVSITVNGSKLQLWRIFFFLAGLPIIWSFGSLIELFVVYVVEKTMFTWKNAIYFAYAIKKPARNVVRAALTLGWWAGIMTAGNSSMVPGLVTAYTIILQIWACITLFMTANLLKTLLAKLLSLKFNQSSHLTKMHESLKKEHFLQSLLQPRVSQPQQPLPEQPPPGIEEEVLDLGKAPSLGGSSGVQGEDASQHAQVEPQVSSPTPTAGGGKAAPPHHGRLLDSIGEDVWEDPTPGDTALIPRTSINITIEQHGSPLKPPPSPVSKGSPTSTAARHGWGALKFLKEGLQPSSGAGPPASNSSNTLLGRSLSRLSRQGTHLRGPGSRQVSRQLTGALPRSVTGKREIKEAKDEARRAQALASVETQEEEEAVKDGALDPKMAERMMKMEKYIRKNALQVRFNDQLVQTERREDVNSELQAKKMGFYLFWHVKQDTNSQEITKKDLRMFLPAAEVQPAFEWLDDDGDGCITLQDCCSAVVKVFMERKNLAASLRDTKSVVGKLENVLGGIIHVFFAFLYLAVFHVDVLHVYLALTSLVVALSFIFSSSLSAMYENVVFLFVIHPFDIGDLLVLGDYFYRVDEINIQFTTLINTSTNARNWWPNQLLMSAPFVNLSASGVKAEMFKVLVDLDTPGSVLDEVRAAMERHVKENATEFTPVVSVNFYISDNPMKMTLSLYWELSHNGTDTGRAGRARSTMFILISETLTRLGVAYSWPEVKQKKTSSVPDGVIQEQLDAGQVVNSGGQPLAGDVLKQKFL